jgi:hypothetical protein
MKPVLFLLASTALVVGLAGCTTYETKLTNAQGQQITCKASGKAGLITGLYLRQGFQQCVSNAEANGYGSNPSSSPTKQ